MSHSSPQHGQGDRPSHESHHDQALKVVATAVITVSDTRTLKTDTGGALVVSMLEEAGHRVSSREIVADEREAITTALSNALRADGTRAVILTGGTGVAPRDVTPDSVEPLLERVVPGFGEFFRMLSFEEIGSSALLSRSLAGIARGRIVFVLPGSRGAVRLGMARLILPELGHLAAEAVKVAGVKSS